MMLPRLLCLALTGLAAFPQSRDERWRADVDFLAREVQQRHPNAFANTPRAEFDRIAAAVRAEIPNLSDRAIQVRMAEITASLRDAHTYLPLGGLPAASIAVRWFDDGLWIIAAPEDHPEWLGTRIVAIGGKPIDEAMAVYQRVVSRDNDYGLKAASPTQDTTRPDIWHALGVTASPDMLPLTLERPGGEQIDAGVAVGQPFRHYAVDTSAGHFPLWMQNANRNYWAMYLESSRTLYVVYNVCAEDPASPVASWADSVFAAFDSRPVSRLIIDIRNNPGGNSIAFNPFLDRLSSRRGRFGAGTTLFTILGRDTASAAIEVERKLRFDHRAVMIGGPTPSKPDFFGATRRYTLPNSGLPFNVSSIWLDLPGSGNVVLPERLIGFTARDFFTRHDPYLAAAMSYSPDAGGSGLSAVRNAASFRAEPGVAPGSYVSIFGNFASPGAVLFGGIAAQTTHTSATQINAIVPGELPLGETLVTVAGEPLGRVPVVAANPGIFSMDALDLRQPGAVLNADNTRNTAANRTQRSQVIQVFGTGFAAGEPTVFIGDEVCRVLYSGPVEGTPGLWQVNVEVPSTARTRGAMPLYAISGEVGSNAVTMWVE